MKRKFALVLFFLMAMIATKVLYRPFIYKNEIKDFGVADMGGNLFHVPLIVFILSFRGYYFKKELYSDTIKVIIILVSAELISIAFPIFGQFDIKDIFAVIIGGIITMYASQFIKLGET